MEPTNQESTTETQSCKGGVIGSLPSQVWMISFGKPTLFNVIGYDYETDQYQIQSPGHFGSRYRERSDAMSLNDIELWLFENAAKESDRLQKLKIELEIHSRSN